jgi:hypothetical protein
MILPTKHISTSHSLIGIGAKIIVHLYSPRTISSLWNDVSKMPEVATFERFVLTLDFLYTIGAIDLDSGLISRRQG